MVKKLLLTICLILLLNISFISAELIVGDTNINNNIVELVTDIPLNVSTANLVFNMSDIWVTDEGFMDNVPDLYPTLDLRYLELDGSNFGFSPGIYLSYSEPNFAFDEAKLNFTVLDLTKTINYNASTIATVDGTFVSGDVESTWVSEDGDIYVVDEDAGANPLRIDLNFSNVDDFDRIVGRIEYEGGQGHQVKFQIKNTTGDWEDYATFTDTAGFVNIDVPVFDGVNHIINNNVSVRFIHIQNGKVGHEFEIDFLQLVDGFMGFSTTDHDGLSGRDNILVNHPNIVDIFYNKSEVDNNLSNYIRNNTDDGYRLIAIEINVSNIAYINNITGRNGTKAQTGINAEAISILSGVGGTSEGAGIDGADGGDIEILTGAGGRHGTNGAFGTSGSIFLTTEDGEDGSGSSGAGSGGNITLTPGVAGALGLAAGTDGVVNILGKTNIIGNPGTVHVAASDVLIVTGGKGGDSIGFGAGGKGSDIFLTTGDGGQGSGADANAPGGDLIFTTGNAGTAASPPATGGDIELTTGVGSDGSSGYGNLIMLKDGGWGSIGNESPIGLGDGDFWIQDDLFVNDTITHSVGLTRDELDSIEIIDVSTLWVDGNYLHENEPDAFQKWGNVSSNCRVEKGDWICDWNMVLLGTSQGSVTFWLRDIAYKQQQEIDQLKLSMCLDNPIECVLEKGIRYIVERIIDEK